MTERSQGERGAKRFLLYPLWTLYPQIVPLEVDDEEASLALRQAVASRVGVRADLLDVYDRENLEARGDSAVSAVPAGAELGVSFGRSTDGAAFGALFPRSATLFEIGQVPAETHPAPAPAQAPPSTAPSALRRGVLLSDDEERLRRALLARGFSDDLDRLATLDVTTILPHRRPGDPKATVVFRLVAHLDENNRSDLDLLAAWLEASRERIAEERIRVPYRIELELDLLVDSEKARLGRWLEFAVAAGERLAGMDRELERPGRLGGNLDRVSVYVYDESARSPGGLLGGRGQCLEAAARVGYLTAAHPEIADSLRRMLGEFVTDYREPFRRRGPRGETAAFTWRSVHFLVEPAAALLALARKVLAQRFLEIYDADLDAIDREGEEDARALLAAVGLLPSTGGRSVTSVSFDAERFHRTLLEALPLRVGRWTAGDLEALPVRLFRREALPALRAALGDGAAGVGYALGDPESTAKALESTVLAQFSAFRGAVYEYYDRLVGEGDLRRARAFLRATDRLLGLGGESAAAEAADADGEAAAREPGVAEHLEQRAAGGAAAEVEVADDGLQAAAKLASGCLGLLLPAFRREEERGTRRRLIRSVVARLAARTAGQASRAVRESLRFGSPFSLAWQLARRTEASCAEQRRFVALLAREVEREWNLSSQGLDEAERSRLAGHGETVARFLGADGGRGDLERRLRGWLQELLSETAETDRDSAIGRAHEVVSERGRELVAEIPPGLVDRRRLDPVAEIAAFEERVLTAPFFGFGFVRDHFDVDSESERQSLKIFVPEGTDKERLADLEHHVAEVAFRFRAGAEVVPVPGLGGIMAIIDWIACPLTAFVPPEVREAPAAAWPAAGRESQGGAAEP